jgi:hypothetical protein
MDAHCAFRAHDPPGLFMHSTSVADARWQANDA